VDEGLEDEGLEDEGLEVEGLEDEGLEDEGLEDEGLEVGLEVGSSEYPDICMLQTAKKITKKTIFDSIFSVVYPDINKPFLRILELKSTGSS